MHIQIVPDHHVSRPEGWRELGAHIGLEGLAVHGAFDHPRRDQFMAAKAGDEGLGVPFSERSLGDEPLPLPAAAPERRHVGLDRGFVDEHEPSGRGAHGRLAVFVPLIAFLFDLGAFSLRRHQRFFYR